MKKILIVLSVFAIISIPIVFAAYPPTWNNFYNQVTKPLDMGVETIVSFPSDNDVTRCFAFSVPNNMNLTKLSGSFSIMKSTPNKNDWVQGGYKIYISPNLVQSDWTNSSSRLSNLKCQDYYHNYVSLATLESIGAEPIATGIYKLKGIDSMNIQPSYDLNTQIKPGSYIIVTMGGDSNTTSGTMDIESQIYGYLK